MSHILFLSQLTGKRPSFLSHVFLKYLFVLTLTILLNLSNVFSDPEDTIWLEDSLPSGATGYAFGGDEWSWISGTPAPYSGTSAHQSNLVEGVHLHFFKDATDTLTINAGDTLITYIYLDPANPPSTVMLNWNDGTWNHAAYWGANNIGVGENGTNSRRPMGALPPAGYWVRLEVPASQVGLQGKVLNGVAFTLCDGRASWDRTGKSGIAEVDTTPPTITAITIDSSTQITVKFSEPLEESVSTNVLNYSIDNAITVFTASLGTDLKTVTLTTSEHVDGTTYNLIVNNISDHANTPNVIAHDTTVGYTFTNQYDSFLQMRIEYYSNSDWTTLDLLDSTNVLISRLISISGNPNGQKIANDGLGLSQSPISANAGNVISMKVDYALAPELLDKPMTFRLNKGYLNASKVSISSINNDNIDFTEDILLLQGSTSEEFTINFSSSKYKMQQIAVPKPLEKKVWAFYYPFYQMSDWLSPNLKDLPETQYSSDDTLALERQIDQAKSAGIDGFILSWWGPDSYTDKNLKLLLDIARNKDFSISILLETFTPIDNTLRNNAEISNWLSYVITTYSDHPAFFKVGNKPLISFWYSGAMALNDWHIIFSDLRNIGLDGTFIAMGTDINCLNVFDGWYYTYAPMNIPNLKHSYISAGRNTNYYHLLSNTLRPKIWIPVVLPGYDEGLIPGREGLFQERNNGDFYRSTCEAAFESDPCFVIITSWNEWWEHTYIEPSDIYGNQYLQITKEFSDTWKAQ